MKGERVLVKKDESWIITRELKRLDVPTKIHDLVLRRVSRLMKEQRQLLEVASVIGEKFSSDLLMKVSEVKRLDALRMLNDLEKAYGLIVSGEGGYAFSHVKIREVIYEGISDELRREYHRMVGDAICTIQSESDENVAEIGYHYFMARDQEKAVPRLLMTVELEKGRFSNKGAMRFCMYALEI